MCLIVLLVQSSGVDAVTVTACCWSCFEISGFVGSFFWSVCGERVMTVFNSPGTCESHDFSTKKQPKTHRMESVLNVTIRTINT